MMNRSEHFFGNWGWSAQRWNELHPPGTRVEVHLDNGSILIARTASRAMVLRLAGISVIWLHGNPRFFRLDRLRPLETKSPQSPRRIAQKAGAQ